MVWKRLFFNSLHCKIAYTVLVFMIVTLHMSNCGIIDLIFSVMLLLLLSPTAFLFPREYNLKIWYGIIFYVLSAFGILNVF